MAVEITVPPMGESITEAVVGKWHKKAGDAVNMDEPVVVLETDKVTIDVPAPASGTLAAITHAEGDKVKVGDVLGTLAAGGAPAAAAKTVAPAAAPVAARAAGLDCWVIPTHLSAAADFSSATRVLGSVSEAAALLLPPTHAAAIARRS